MADPVYYLDATELAALIRTKALSALEVMQAHLKRIDAINPRINAIVTVMADQALEAARAAHAPNAFRRVTSCVPRFRSI